jgi:hypothetical protein
MDYQYDIFISYKRHPEFQKWLKLHFEPLLGFHVENELGRPPIIFRDELNTDAGSTWPLNIGQALGNSRVLVALWTKAYFHSEWCSRELATMMARERDEGLRTANDPDGLIVPVVLHDCEQLPPELEPIQYVPIRECFNVRMHPESALAELLSKSISERVAPGVARAVERAPAWRRAWPLTTADQFMAAIRKPGAPRQLEVPRFAP